MFISVESTINKLNMNKIIKDESKYQHIIFQRIQCIAGSKHSIGSLIIFGDGEILDKVQSLLETV